ncbi:hypothetical protein OIU79_024742 [Salix purpurea]|uniref:Uncharacterized protein n=1 Tax=Salix purpurea TaxID=77065 RepID=A0A9Q0W2Z8_SALPP|nr:hypothetical protein OIU79_024742 [Salix purpurea]
MLEATRFSRLKSTFETERREEQSSCVRVVIVMFFLFCWSSLSPTDSHNHCH